VFIPTKWSKRPKLNALAELSNVLAGSFSCSASIPRRLVAIFATGLW
jgi:hypothetical protein